MPRPAASVVPLVTWTHPSGTANRPQGATLADLFAEVRTKVWAAPSVSDSRRKSARRTAELVTSLPEHPTPAEVAAWVESLRRIFPSEHTVALHLRTVATVYKYGADLGLSTGNPAAIISRIVAKPPGDPRPLADIGSKWPALMSVCCDARERLFLGLQRYAGLRRSETLGVWHSDVNTYMEPWRLEVVRQRPKPNDLFTTRTKSECSQRELPLRGPLRDLVVPVLALGEPVVRTGRGGGERAQVPYLCPLREQDLNDLAARCRSVCPDDFPEGHKMWHALRDTLAVELYMRGKPGSDIASALGHSSEYVTRTHYLGHVGRRVHASVFEGLDPPLGGAPPGAVPGGAESREAGASTPAPRRRSKAVPPAAKPEVSRCGTPNEKDSTRRSRPSSTSTQKRSGPQRALPGMAVGPVVTPPKRRSGRS